MKVRRAKQLLPVVAGLLVVLGMGVGVSTVQAASNSTFNQTINGGTLSTDIMDAGGSSVSSPSVAMSAKTASFTCQSGGSASTGTFGTNTERVYVANPGASATGWTLTLAATSGATALWTSGGNTFDFNDSGTSGCSDGADADTKAGQLTVNASAGTLTADCASCTTSNITKGSSASYVQGTTDSITLLNAAAASDDVWRGYLTGTTLSQTVPAETATGAYTVNMTLTATAQ